MRRPPLVTLSNGTSYNATVAGTDSPDDLALRKVCVPNLRVMQLAASSKVQVGQFVLAVGNPLGYAQTVTFGIVSTPRRTMLEGGSPVLYIPDMIQASAPINPGNSCGALVDLQGRLIGIPTLAVTDPNQGTADVRGRAERPHGFGVEALQGALTLWNRQADPEVVITAELLDISAGSMETPVRGSGVFVGGHEDWDGAADGGTVWVSTLRTGEINTAGGILPGTPDLISGAVFVLSGALVDQVINEGPVSTNGQNDMVLDNWGEVTTWTAKAPVISNGPTLDYSRRGGGRLRRAQRA